MSSDSGAQGAVQPVFLELFSDQEGQFQGLFAYEPVFVVNGRVALADIPMTTKVAR